MSDKSEGQQVEVSESMSLTVAVAVLLLVIGFPRVYGTEVPMAIFLIPFFLLGFVRYLARKGTFTVLLLILFGGWLVGGALISLSGTSADLFFHLVVSIKLLLNVFFGYVVYRVVKLRPNALLVWLALQSVVILVSIFNQGFYNFLLGFISPRSADVFQHVFGLRGLGFGLFHIDGALTLIIAVFYFLLVTPAGFGKNIVLIMMFPVAMAVARSAIIPFSIFGAARKGIGFKAVLVLAVVAMIGLSFYVTEGPFYEATEVFRNLLSHGELRSASVNSLAEMYALPSTVDTYLFGDGRYYSEDESELGFYMGTDVGYLRLLYFSGVGSVAVFLVLNTYFLFGVLLSGKYIGSKDIKIFALSLLAVFFIINFKGLQIMPLFAMAVYMYAEEKRHKQQA
ncbi:hypothetical protein [Pseudomonas wadenswilerensis]|nr:hypothetical protein [Pseudomonas wadenswilerensis]